MAELANRRAFDAALAAACAGASPERSLGLVTLDLDHYKAVDDMLGHEVGDCLLQQVGRRLEKIARSKDLVARLGGDEFAITANGPIDIFGLNKLAQRIMQTFSTDMRHRQDTVPIPGFHRYCDSALAW